MPWEFIWLQWLPLLVFTLGFLFFMPNAKLRYLMGSLMPTSQLQESLGDKLFKVFLYKKKEAFYPAVILGEGTT